MSLVMPLNSKRSKSLLASLCVLLFAAGPALALVVAQNYDSSLTSTLAPYATGNYASLAGKSNPIGSIATDGKALWVRYEAQNPQSSSVNQITRISDGLDQSDLSNQCGESSLTGPLNKKPGMTSTNIVFDGTNVATLAQTTGSNTLSNTAVGTLPAIICFRNTATGSLSYASLKFTPSSISDQPTWSNRVFYEVKLMFDGASYWSSMINYDGYYYISKLSRIDSTTFAVTTANTVKLSGTLLDYVWDGNSVVALEPGKIEKITTTSTGIAITDSIILPTMCTSTSTSSVYGNLAFDGINLWASVGSGSTKSIACAELTKISPQKTLTKVTLPALLAGPMALDQPGYSSASGAPSDSATYIWLADYVSGTLTKIETQSGSVKATYKVGSGTNGVVFDGNYIWASNQLSKNIFKMRVR